MNTDQAVVLMTAFDTLDCAIQRVEVALPFQMTEAVKEMEIARRQYRVILQTLLAARASKGNRRNLY